MPDPEHFDVVVIGAGISGIGAGYHLQDKSPDRSYVILDGRSDLGGTWDLFQYPGVRSDSDMHTLGYSFKPWKDNKAIARGPAILEYLRETAKQFGIDQHIRYDHSVTRAEWDTESSHWTVTANLGDSGETTTLTCTFLFMCSGYYSYKGGYQPEFVGQDRFEGEIVHPQSWPTSLDYDAKKVVVIGSGATAVTLIPAMATQTAHITMLQRSPTYMVAMPDEDKLANLLHRVLPEKLAHRIVRRKNLFLGQAFYHQTRTKPDRVKKKLLSMLRDEMPDADIDTDFTPTYNPWDQRICVVPNADLFKALSSGRASVVTDEIKCFTETGITLRSSDELEADIIITATGLQMVTLGDMDFTVDGKPVDFAKTWSYKGLAYSGVPNLVSSFGYINASWTLRSDMTCEYVCRVLNHMRDTGTDQCTARLRRSDSDMAQRPLIDDFSSGYMVRMMPLLPKQGDRAPWLNPQRYNADVKAIAKQPVNDEVMQFTSRNAVN